MQQQAHLPFNIILCFAGIEKLAISFENLGHDIMFLYKIELLSTEQ